MVERGKYADITSHKAQVAASRSSVRFREIPGESPSQRRERLRRLIRGPERSEGLSTKEPSPPVPVFPKDGERR